MGNPFILKLEHGARLTDSDRETLEKVSSNSRRVPAYTDLIQEGDNPRNVHLVLEGFVCRYKVLEDGKRQIMAFFVPGDICDLHVHILGEMDHSIGTLVDSVMAEIEPHTVEMLTSNPRINRALWWATLVDEGTLREWLVNMGQRAADQQMAHIFCELLLRLQVVGHAEKDSFLFPLTQQELADYMKCLDDGDAEEERISGGSGRGDGKLAEKIAAIRDKRDRHKALLEELERSGEDQISLTDPDARAMARMTKVGVGYNVQLAVDVKHKLIAEQEVCNRVIDLGLLSPTVEAAMDTLGVERIEAVADRGYFKIEDIEACEQAGITAYVPRPIRGLAVRHGYFAKELFRYDPGEDVYVCPGGATLYPRYEGKVRDNRKIEYCDRAACKTCALKPRCTGNLYRRVSRLENEAILDRMAARLDARPDILDRRRESVEHPFGTIKQWMNQGTFLMRGLENVRGEFSLTALAYNIKRAITLVGVQGLIAAVRA